MGSNSIANLVDDRNVTAHLIARPLDWRVRVVEEVSIDTATSCKRRRSIQVAPLRKVLATFLDKDDDHEFAMLALNIAPIPRGPLLEFDAQGPAGEAFLLPRVEIAARQSLFLRTLLESCDIEISGELYQLLEGMMGFVGDPKLRSNKLRTIEDYIADGLGRKPEKSESMRWRQIDEACAKVLRPRADCPGPYSAPETPSIVIPYLQSVGSCASDADATRILREYQGLLTKLALQANADSPTAADDFLNSLADYGQNYDLIAVMKVPLDQPFLIKFSERRSLKLTPFRNRASQELVVADALTNHVTVRVLDPSTEIKRFKATEIAGTDSAFGRYIARADAQTRSFYAFDDDRDYRVRLEFSLALLHRIRIVPILVAAVIGLATAALWIERPTALSDLAIIVGLSGLAASVLYTREPSTLGSRLRLGSSILVLVAVASLVVSAAVIFGTGTERRAGPETCPKYEVPSTQRGGCNGQEHRTRVTPRRSIEPKPSSDAVGHVG